ncbi:GntR family transcriptional regulator [Singulisphaera rosea]
MMKVQTLSNRVYDYLLPMILTGELAPGGSLREVELANRLGVSRTPIREALHRLAEYGVVEMRANHGAVVRRLGREELIHFHQMREALEGLAAELACGHVSSSDFDRLDSLAEAARDISAPGYFEAFDRFDVELHSLIGTRSGNPLLSREIVKLHGLTMLIHDQIERVLIATGLIPMTERSDIRIMCWNQHLNIIEALRSRHPEACRRAMVDHLRETCRYKISLMVPSGSPSDEGSPTPKSTARQGSGWGPEAQN